MSPGARESLSAAGVGWVDETGAAEIAVSGIVVSRSGHAAAPRRLAGWTRGALAVAEAILCETAPTVAATWPQQGCRRQRVRRAARAVGVRPAHLGLCAWAALGAPCHEFRRAAGRLRIGRGRPGSGRVADAGCQLARPSRRPLPVSETLSMNWGGLGGNRFRGGRFVRPTADLRFVGRGVRPRPRATTDRRGSADVAGLPHAHFRQPRFPRRGPEDGALAPPLCRPRAIGSSRRGSGRTCEGHGPVGSEAPRSRSLSSGFVDAYNA
jgi:hypothetical protein